ncbi:unnamed protein product [Nezara viridula]|uniref:Uncharacterized protein n=1 Tax=Nezara viridula TaxID=85310 RepID=A0A9P0E6K4_NEZVI|nr:unnamed protein product [Nezara viridula]
MARFFTHVLSVCGSSALFQSPLASNTSDAAGGVAQDSPGVPLSDYWFKLWKMRLDHDKSKHIRFTLRKNTCPPVYIENNQIPQTDTDPANLRPELVPVPPERDLLDPEERVHGLGAAQPEPAVGEGRHPGSPL